MLIFNFSNIIDKFQVNQQAKKNSQLESAIMKLENEKLISNEKLEVRKVYFC